MAMKFGGGAALIASAPRRPHGNLKLHYNNVFSFTQTWRCNKTDSIWTH
jgi:hypothetical protein